MSPARLGAGSIQRGNQGQDGATRRSWREARRTKVDDPLGAVGEEGVDGTVQLGRRRGVLADAAFYDAGGSLGVLHVRHDAERQQRRGRGLHGVTDVADGSGGGQSHQGSTNIDTHAFTTSPYVVSPALRQLLTRSPAPVLASSRDRRRRPNFLAPKKRMTSSIALGGGSDRRGKARQDPSREHAGGGS